MRRLCASAILLFAAASNAQTTQPDVMQQLQKVMGSKNGQQHMGQLIIVGSLLACTQKTVGKEAAQTFYQEMQTVGKTAGTYCKQGNATEARALLMATFTKNRDSAVVKAALGCYDAQVTAIEALGGARMATDAANYAKWVRDPTLAEKELKETDICKNTAR